jgi:hypothetical protein
VSAPHHGGAHDEVEPVGAGAEAEPDEDAVVDELTHVVDDDPPVRADEADLATALAQRDEYLDALQRVKAEFDNFRKRTERQRADLVARAAEDLARSLLPVLDACEAARRRGRCVRPHPARGRDARGGRRGGRGSADRGGAARRLPLEGVGPAHRDGEGARLRSTTIGCAAVERA